MLDDMFSFIDPIIEWGDDDTAHLVIQADLLSDFLEKTGLDKEVHAPEKKAIKVPLDVALSLMDTDELEKLRNYITFYLAKYPQK